MSPRVALSPNTRPAPERARRQTRVWGHFGEILQGRLGRDGPLVLLTLPAPGVSALGAAASWRPAAAAPLLVSGSGLRGLAAAGLKAGLAREARAGWGGRLEIETSARFGGGCGASTASLLAGLRLGAPALRPWDEAAALLALEGAVDPLMLREPGRWLWASRAARPIRRLARPPALLVAGGYDGPGRRTLSEAPGFADIADLAEAAARAARAGDAAAFAAVATRSAERRQAAAPKPRFEALRALAAETGALGIVAAHTGPAAGLLFGPWQTERAAAAAAALREIGFEAVLSFRSDGRPVSFPETAPSAPPRSPPPRPVR